MKKELELYLHIPFCVRKCAYCDFLSFPAEKEIQKQYVNCLIEEIRQFDLAEDYVVSTIFFGGGTPSVLEGSEIMRIMQAIRERFPDIREDAEITIECNPGTLTEEKLQIYQKAGINRLSLGLQSADQEELKLLGRIHTYNQFKENFYLARRIGFANINVDLMSALPGQSVESYRCTLKKVCELGPEHISAYSLIIEDGTPFAKRTDRMPQKEKPEKNRSFCLRRMRNVRCTRIRQRFFPNMDIIVMRYRIMQKQGMYADTTSDTGNEWTTSVLDLEHPHCRIRSVIKIPMICRNT